MPFYVVRCRDGEVFRKNGSFGGEQSQMRDFRNLNAAKASAVLCARYRRGRMRVDNENGETLFETDGGEAGD